MRTIFKTTLVVAFAGSVGCATVVAPPELVTARSAYDRASTGVAASLDPADLHVARESLNTAEVAFTKDGATEKTKDLAYGAERATEIAEARARTMQSLAQKEQVLTQLQATQTSQVALTSAQLGQANQQLAAQSVALANETQRRLDAERHAAQAAADSAKFATVKQEARGMVITLSGSVLFTSANWTLLPEAQAKLTEVASALTKESPDSKIVVEGYTDSQGGASYNLDLSQKRADSVRTFLVAQGIASDRITAQGLGLTSPIADNSSAEGRANNRRVEIIVQPPTK